MPIAPQITNTPVDLIYFEITAVSYTSSTATYTATGHSYAVGDTVTVSGLSPDGYNGVFTVTAKTTNTFTVANTTNIAVTVATGDSYGSASDTSFDANYTPLVYMTDTEDLADPNINLAYADAQAAQATATAAQAAASTAYDTAVAANTAASTAQSTADGKNKVTYSTTTPGTTSNKAGDIWYQYGTSGANNGRIIAQYMGAGGTSWTQTTVSGLVVANLDAGSITTGTLSVALGITGTGGSFTVNAVTGALYADSVTIKGQVSATSGYFGTSTDGFSITSTGLVGLGSGAIIGGTIATASSGARLTFNESSSNAIRIYPDSSLQPGYISASSVSGTGSLRINGPYTSGWNNSNIQLYSLTSSLSYIQLNADVTSVVGGAAITGGLSVSGTITYPGVATASGSTLVVVSTGSRIGYVSSSRTTKKNIAPLTAGSFVDKLLSLEPVSFDWKDQPEDMPYRQNYGLIAEDVAESANELESIVNYNQNGEAVSISYDRLTTFLVMAIKELKAEINELKGV